MATAAVLTPVRSRREGFYSRHAVPTPSPKTPRAHSFDGGAQDESIHHGNPVSKFSLSRSALRDSPKSNIAARPARRVEQIPSDLTLTGTFARPNTSSGTQKTPKRTPKRTHAKINYTAADRFIPVRSGNSGSLSIHTTSNSGSRVELSDPNSLSFENLNLNSNDEDESTTSNNKASPSTLAFQKSIAEACGMRLEQRILAYKPEPPKSSRPIDLRSQFNRPLKPATVAATRRRRVLTAPERVLDAPGLADDYYLNLLDWSSGNQVAIGLDRNVYVWSAESGSVSSLLECPEDTYIASVKWSGDGAYVAAGLGTGEVQIWDVEEGTKLRSMFGHEKRVSVMGWNKHILSTGAQCGSIFNHDVRIAQHKIAELMSHTSEVCGLEWRPDGAQLATGGNDNLVNIWDARHLSAPKHQKTNHKAAVKALAWCPWQYNLLATGGGSHDRHIHFWNTTSGARVNSIDTGSQVTSLRWSHTYKELVSSSGFPDNSLSIWSYPTLVKNIEIPAHESRVLHSALSPDGQMLATAAADESLKFWKIFERKPGMTSLTPTSHC